MLAAIEKAEVRLFRQGALVGGADHARCRLRLETRGHQSRQGEGRGRRRDRSRCQAGLDRRANRGRGAAGLGEAVRLPSERRSCDALPTSTRRMPSSSSRWRRARPARRSPTASPKCAKPSTSCATTRPRRAAAEAGTEARGAIVCISPWNFPLAIFTGQIAAALVTGNSVIAKPAEQTPLIAARAVALLREAGVPEDVIQLLPGDGPSVGAPLTADPRICRRLLHRLDRGRQGDRAATRQDGFARRHADRRDRRPQRDDRRFHSAAGAGGARHSCFGLPECRPALLGAAHPLRPEGRREEDDRDAEGRARGARRRRPVADLHRRRAADRRGSAEGRSATIVRQWKPRAG